MIAEEPQEKSASGEISVKPSVAATVESLGDLSSLISLPPDLNAPSLDPTQSQAGNEAPPAAQEPPGPVEFESLEELSKSTQNALPDPSIQAETGTGALSETPVSAPAPLANEDSGQISGMDMSGISEPVGDPTFASTPEAATAGITGFESALAEPSAQEADPESTAATAPLSTSAPRGAPDAGMDSIKRFSDNLGQAESQAAAAFPFTLRIEGRLTAEETEKLMNALSRENMGFREVDLEPQIAAGRILLPRISEYAGILLIQALRGVSAKIEFGPADEIFSTPDTRDDTRDDVRESGFGNPPESATVFEQQQSPQHPAEALPVTHADSFPQFAAVEALSTVIVTGLLSTRAVETASSSEYENLLEALLRELRFKAHRRGASGVISLQIQLTPLTLPTDYRVTVSGTAIRIKNF